MQPKLDMDKLRQFINRNDGWLRGERGGQQLTLRGVDLSGLDLSGMSMAYGTFIDVNLSGADLSRSNLENVKFTRVNLSCARLRKARLTDAAIDESRLIRTDLTDADLAGINAKDDARRRALKHCSGLLAGDR